MANLTKFYLRSTFWTSVPELVGAGGTAPSNTTLDAASPSVTALDAPTNYALQAVAGSAQVTASISTLGQTAAQSGWISRFMSPPLAAQTIGAQSVSYVGAFSESNGASDFRPTFGLYLWRPSNGTLVSTLIAVGSGLAAEPGTTQTIGTATATSAAATATTGDVLVLEVWRNSGTQVNTASRTNSIFYNGTTENSTTSNAAYLSFATAVVVPTVFEASLSATLSPIGTANTAYTPAPSTTYGLVAVHTHSE